MSVTRTGPEGCQGALNWAPMMPGERPVSRTAVRLMFYLVAFQSGFDFVFRGRASFRRGKGGREGSV